ncbi:MAG: hypothetical protein K2M75_02360 [Clostridia bacterium]|nr:hypothetical protein [Clostridia bacterium]
MERKYIDMILNSYEEDGISYTEFYKRYGIDKAGLVAGNPKEFVNAFNGKCISQIIFVDAGLSSLNEFKYVEKLCIVYTHKPKKIIDLNALYDIKLETLLICGKDSYFKDKLAIKRLDGLKRLKISMAQLSCDKSDCKLTSLEIDDIGRVDNLNFLTSFLNLEYLTLSGGVINKLEGIHRLKKLRSFTFSDVEILDVKGLRELSGLVNLSVMGKFDENIICELPYLRNLEYLKLDAHIKINDVKWVGKLNNLKTIVLGCIVKDGNLIPLRKIPYVLLKTQQQNYNLKDKDFSKCVETDNEYGIPVYKKF